MRYIFHLLFLLNIAIIGAMPFALPQKIAVHFGAGGVPNRWSSVTVHVVLVGSMFLFVYLALWGCSWLVKYGSVDIINPPINKKYWKTKENIPKLRVITEKLFWEISVVTLFLVLVVNGMVFFGNLRNPPNAPPEILVYVFIFFGIYFSWWLVRCVSAYRIPKNDGEENGTTTDLNTSCASVSADLEMEKWLPPNQHENP